MKAFMSTEVSKWPHLSHVSAHRLSPFLLVSGLSHRTAPVALRERLSVAPLEQAELLRQLVQCPGVGSASVLSTCNRLEVVVSGDAARTDLANVKASIESVFESASRLKREDFVQSLYHLENEAAVRHIFQVASGLDSLVVGEPQILGQMKSAFRDALKLGTTDAVLNRLFERAFGAAKAVRTTTAIGERAVSVCYAARELAKQIFGDLQDASVMLVGAGETGQLAVKHFCASGVKRFYIANRTLERSLHLASTVNGVALSLSGIEEFLPQVDIIIGAATLSALSPAVVSAASIQRAQAAGRTRPLFCIDLGVPRNFEASIAEMDEVFLYNIDDLESIVSANMSSRQQEVERAKLIVDEEVRKFQDWLQDYSYSPTIRKLQQQQKEFRNVEIERTMKRLRSAGFSEEQLEVLKQTLESFAAALSAKSLHAPVTTLKRIGRTDSAIEEVFRELLLSES